MGSDEYKFYYVRSARKIRLRWTAANNGEQLIGGGSGIRTHDTVSRIHAFQACALSHSAIPPPACGTVKYSPARLSDKAAHVRSRGSRAAFAGAYNYLN